MALSPAQFRLQFLAFQNLQDDQIQAYLDAAYLEINPDRWGTLIDQGAGYLAAHLMAVEPWAAGMRLVNAADGSTPYLKEYERKLQLVTVGFMAI